MSPHTRILGWTPPGNDSYVGLSPHQHLAPQQNPPFHIAEPNGVGSQTSPSSRSSPTIYEQASPSSSVSSLAPDVESLSERPSGGGKRDASWIARPRNCFMIFRCQYSCENRREGKRVRRPRGSQPEKSLSKRAAEAWHELSADKKEYFQVLAHKEASEHARLHPGYRFKPTRRSMGKRRGVRSSCFQMDHHSSPETRVEGNQDLLSTTQSETPPQLIHMHLVKSPYPRSSSVPLSPEEHGVSNSEFSRNMPRKSRSFTEDWMGMPNPSSPIRWFDEDQSPFTHDYVSPSGMLVHDSIDSGITSPNTPVTEYMTSGGYWSPLIFPSSSLENWNGAHGIEPASSLQSSQYTMFMPLPTSPLSPLPGNEFDHSLAQLPQYSNSSEYAQTPSQMHCASSTELWVQQLSHHAAPMGGNADVLPPTFGAGPNVLGPFNSSGQILSSYEAGLDPSPHRVLEADTHPVYWP